MHFHVTDCLYLLAYVTDVKLPQLLTSMKQCQDPNVYFMSKLGCFINTVTRCVAGFL